jgi:hypothetical protein
MNIEKMRLDLFLVDKTPAIITQTAISDLLPGASAWAVDATLRP